MIPRSKLENWVTRNGRVVGNDRRGMPYYGGIGAWTNSEAYTADGRTMTPKGGETYYLKEVPLYFLQPYLYAIYDMYDENTVKDMYLLCNVDDNNYRDIGLFVEDIEAGSRTKLTVALTVTKIVQGEEVQDRIDFKTVAEASYFIVDNLAKGYVGVWHPGVQAVGAQFSFTPYFITPDGITVEGCFQRNVDTGDGMYYEEEQEVNGTMTLVPFLEPGIHFENIQNPKCDPDYAFLSTRESN